MDIRKLTLTERNNPFSLFKNRINNSEMDILKKINFNNRAKSFSEVESFVILMRFLKKDELFIKKAVDLTPVKEDDLKYFINYILNEIELELEKAPDSSDEFLKEKLYDSQTLTGYNFNDNILEYRNCSSILINDFKTMIETMKRADDFTSLKESYENKKCLMKSLILIMKYNNIEDEKELGLENELDTLSLILSNQKYNEIKLKVSKPEVPLKEDHKPNKPKKNLKYRPKMKRRLIIPKPHL